MFSYKTITIFLCISIVGAFICVFNLLDVGDKLPPQQVKKYTYALLNSEDGNFLAKIDAIKDKIFKKYSIRDNIFPSTVDLDGNVYFEQFISGVFGNNVYVFYPARGRYRRIVNSKGRLHLKTFRYKDKLYVLCSEQDFKKHTFPPRQSGLEVYDLRTKTYIKTLYFNDFGTSTKLASYIDYKKGLFITTAVNLNSMQYTDDDEKTFIHIIDLNTDKSIVNKNLSLYTMGDAYISSGNGEIYFSSMCKNYTKHPNINIRRSAILGYSIKTGRIEEKIRFNNINDRIRDVCYNNNNNKLYLNIENIDSFSGLRIIDCLTWKVIKEIPLFIGKMTMVNENKIYLQGLKNIQNYDESKGIYVLDTRTDKIIKFIKGNFLDIAENAWYY